MQHIQCPTTHLGAHLPGALHEIVEMRVRPREGLILIYAEVAADQEHRAASLPLTTREYRTEGETAAPYIAQYLPVGYANLLGRPEFAGAQLIDDPPTPPEPEQNSEEQN